MKIAVFIDDFHQRTPSTAEFIKKIRRTSACDYLIALMSGDFAPSGPAPVNKFMRTEWALSHGVDLVIEKSVYTCLCDTDLYAFSAISLLNKLDLPCTLYLPCNVTDPEILRKITMKLLVTDQRFKDQIYTYMKKGCSFWTARANVMEQSIPGAGQALLDSRNNYAVEYLKSIKYCYSPIQTELIHDDRISVISSENATSPEHNDFSRPLKDYLLHSTHRPESIWGCTHSIATKVAQYMDDFTDFSSFAQLLSTDRHPYEEICQILYRMILRISRPKFTLFSLHDYALYARILGCRKEAVELLELLLQNSKIPVLCCPKQDADQLDHSEQRLWKLDLQSSEIYHRASAEKNGIMIPHYAGRDLLIL